MNNGSQRRSRTLTGRTQHRNTHRTASAGGVCPTPACVTTKTPTRSAARRLRYRAHAACKTSDGFYLLHANLTSKGEGRQVLHYVINNMLYSSSCQLHFRNTTLGNFDHNLKKNLKGRGTAGVY